MNPEDASGRAILAVQQASQSPVTEQRESYKNFVEDVAKIWLEYLIAYSADGISMEKKVAGPDGQETVQIVSVPQTALKKLQASVKIDVTPKGIYDKFAQEQTIENLLIQGFLTSQRVGELEIYAELLDDDAVAPKMKIQEACELVREEQKRIAMIQAQAQAMQQQAQQFIMEGPDAQAQQIAEAQQMAEAQKAEVQQASGTQNPEIAPVQQKNTDVIEDNPDDN